MRKKIKWLLVISCCWIIGVDAALNAETFKTPNNIEIILLKDPKTDLISLSFGFKGAGAVSDELTKAGLSSAMMDLIFRSNADGMDRYKKARKIKNLGILSGINYNVSDEHIQLQMKCPVENLKKSLDLLHTILFKAELTNTELNKIKHLGISNSSLANADEYNFALSALRANIFSGTPYANPTDGNQQGLQVLTSNDIKKAFVQKLAKDNLIVAVVGNVDKNTISTYIDKTFSNLADKAILPKIEHITAKLNGQVKTIYKDSPQSTAVFAQESINRKNKDFYSFLLLNQILGGQPFTSRLWLEIREKQGLVYGIRTSILTNLQYTELMTGYFQADNKDVTKVINIIKEQWTKIKEQGVAKEEFMHAKTGLIGLYALNFLSPDSISSYLLWNRLSGFDVEWINTRNDRVKAITLADVNRVAKEYLHPEQLSFFIIGDPK